MKFQVGDRVIWKNDDYNNPYRDLRQPYYFATFFQEFNHKPGTGAIEIDDPVHARVVLLTDLVLAGYPNDILKDIL